MRLIWGGGGVGERHILSEVEIAEVSQYAARTFFGGVCFYLLW